MLQSTFNSLFLTYAKPCLANHFVTKCLLWSQLSGLLKDAPSVMHWWEELTKKGQPSPSSRCTLIVALCRSKALTEALEALNEMSNVLSKEDPFHLLPGKKRRPFKTEKVDELPVLEAAKEDTAPSELRQTSREAIPTEAETGIHTLFHMDLVTSWVLSCRRRFSWIFFDQDKVKTALSRVVIWSTGLL